LLSTTTTTGEAKQSANPVSGTSGEDQEAQKCEPEDEEGSVYEPIDVSVPFPPRRTKRHIKGTRTESPQRNIYKRGPLTGTDAVPQGGVPSSTRQSSRARTPSAAAKSIPGKGKREDGVEGKLSTLNIEDEGGVDEYVDMDYRAEKDATRRCPVFYSPEQQSKNSIGGGKVDTRKGKERGRRGGETLDSEH
jgi:hypothetical protein